MKSSKMKDILKIVVIQDENSKIFRYYTFLHQIFVYTLNIKFIFVSISIIFVFLLLNYNIYEID